MAHTDQSVKTALKTKSTYYTDDMVKNARNNVSKFNWAKELMEEAVQKANQYLAYGTDMLWSLVTSQSIPRSIDVCNLGCPVCGTKIFKEHGSFSWKTDVFRNPWKIICPSCDHIFPSNNFASYYKSGMDINGFFDPEKADRTLLKNELYPDKPSDWGVDDGYGWIDENKRHWKFIAYYNHMGLWSLNSKIGGAIINALNAFEDAYILTGDIRYAEAGLIILDRIADVYPDMDLSPYKDSDGYFNSHGHTGQGKISGSISETYVVKPFLTAYDAFFPALVNTDIVSFLNKKSKTLKMNNPKDTHQAIQKNIEDGIVKQVFTAVKNAQIRGNTGMHQSSLALAALIIDNEELSREWMEWVFKPGGVKIIDDGRRILTGGNMDVALIDDVDRDGIGNESAPSYNYLWLKEFTILAKITQRFKDNPEWNLFLHPKIRKMYHAFIPLIFSSKYTPQIGDTGAAGKPELVVQKEDMILAYKIYRSDILAQAAYFLNGNSKEGIHDDIFSEDPERIVQDIEKVIKTNGTFKPKSDLLSGYGLAKLCDGYGNNERSAWVYFGRNVGHGHKDTLNLGMYALGLDMAPDLGNPEYKKPDWPKRYEWTENTISHNTVVVDAGKQKSSLSGNPHHFDINDSVKHFDVEAPDAYPQTSMYRRNISVIKIDDTNSYILDIFRVKGGSDHVYSFHGPEGNVSVNGLNMQKRPGTYAGDDIPFGQAYDKKEKSSMGYQGSGFHYLYNVEFDENPPSQFTVDWQVKDTWKVLDANSDVHLSLTMLSHLNDVALASGDPAKNQPGNPENLKYVLAHRSGDNLNSRFISILEPYIKEKNIIAIKTLNIKFKDVTVTDMEAVALKILLKNGRTDYIISSINGDRIYIVDNRFIFSGYFSLYQEQNGKPVYAFLSEGSVFGELKESIFTNTTPLITGTIIDFTKKLDMENQIVIKANEAVLTSLKDKKIYVLNSNNKQVVFSIENYEISGDKIILDIGDVTLINKWKDTMDLSKGYDYVIDEGNTFRIPLSYEWNNKI